MKPNKELSRLDKARIVLQDNSVPMIAKGLQVLNIRVTRPALYKLKNGERDISNSAYRVVDGLARLYDEDRAFQAPLSDDEQDRAELIRLIEGMLRITVSPRISTILMDLREDAQDSKSTMYRKYFKD